MLPGHELSGVCVAVGSKVTKIKVGDHIGVGCMVDSCGKCGSCKSGEEQKCSSQVGTYNAPATPRAQTFPPGGRTLGGYTNIMVVQEHFAIVIPKSYPLEFAGPVMCAGVTLFDPLRRYGASSLKKVAIVGLGGLGMMGIKLANAMGATVTAISRSASKKDIAAKAGADKYIASSDNAQMAEYKGYFDLVLNTIPW